MHQFSMLKTFTEFTRKTPLSTLGFEPKSFPTHVFFFITPINTFTLIGSPQYGYILLKPPPVLTCQPNKVRWPYCFKYQKPSNAFMNYYEVWIRYRGSRKKNHQLQKYFLFEIKILVNVWVLICSEATRLFPRCWMKIWPTGNKLGFFVLM